MKLFLGAFYYRIRLGIKGFSVSHLNESGGVDKMDKNDILMIDQNRLVQEWSQAMPMVLNASDQAEIKADAADPKAIWVHIATAGHSDYSFDFKCTYVDSREVKVEFVDVEKEGRNVDERTDIIQTLIEDYVRHIHECAQQLQVVTHH
jgi:hypothetical protein